MTKTLTEVQAAAVSSTGTLEALTVRAEGAARRRELLVASLHDLPEPPDPTASTPNAPAAPQQAATPGETSDILFLRHPTPTSSQEATS